MAMLASPCGSTRPLSRTSPFAIHFTQGGGAPVAPRQGGLQGEGRNHPFVVVFFLGGDRKREAPRELKAAVRRLVSPCQPQAGRKCSPASPNALIVYRRAGTHNPASTACMFNRTSF